MASIENTLRTIEQIFIQCDSSDSENKENTLVEGFDIQQCIVCERRDVTISIAVIIDFLFGEKAFQSVPSDISNTSRLESIAIIVIVECFCFAKQREINFLIYHMT